MDITRRNITKDGSRDSAGTSTQWKRENKLEASSAKPVSVSHLRRHREVDPEGLDEDDEEGDPLKRPLRRAYHGSDGLEDGPEDEHMDGEDDYDMNDEEDADMNDGKDEDMEEDQYPKYRSKAEASWSTSKGKNMAGNPPDSDEAESHGLKQQSCPSSGQCRYLQIRKDKV
jgi:hypothetical protein